MLKKVMATEYEAAENEKNAAAEADKIIKKAKEMGMYVITTGNAPNLIGHQYADEYIPADYSD